MSRTYATKEQYVNLAEEAFSGTDGVLTKRLRSASVEVDNLIRFARFDADATGMPTDAALLETLTEATCAIVEFWEQTDDPWGVDALAGQVKIGSVALGTTSASPDSSTPREKLENRIGRKAVQIIESAGLLSAAVSHT